MSRGGRQIYGHFADQDKRNGGGGKYGKHKSKRGKPKRLSKGVRSLIRAPRREHSRKPDEQYERIEALCNGPRLELFARQQREGWTAWGNETGKFIADNDNLLANDNAFKEAA